ncbi:hypothetical protein [Methylohalobius crimeensis]|uniref:hypothetical protein n=1 Tax=Methylohalobius crimeensis TaxID=244365 RepID=UPI00126917AB|nr:hypothetical protein [Methylohalobius crimeensis]
MKTIRKVLTAAMIAASAGTMVGMAPTSAIAAESAEGVNQAISDVKKAVTEAIAISNEGTDADALLNKISEAKQYYKEITGDAYGAKIQRLSGRLRQARGMTKRGDFTGAGEKLEEALEIANSLPPA